MSSIPHDHATGHAVGHVVDPAVDRGHAHDEHAHHPGGIMRWITTTNH